MGEPIQDQNNCVIEAYQKIMFDNSTNLSNISSPILCDFLHSKSLTVSDSVYFAFGFGFIAFVGIFGNLLVVLAVVTAGYMRNVTNFLLLNLAIADVGNLLACLPEVSQILLKESWFLPQLICPIVRYLQVLFLYSSVSFQVGVAAER